MKAIAWENIADDCLAGALPADEILRQIIESPADNFLPILNAAFRIRQAHFGKEIFLHILNNVQNGSCPEDCHYCAQSKNAATPIEEYTFKNDEEILAEAQAAVENGAYRYCMVFAGRKPSLARIEHLALVVREIKQRFNLQVCVSPGILDAEQARVLKEAGVDRINHNLNTSERHYPKICTTHQYRERLETLRIVRQAGMTICSGVIVGMGEDADDIIQMAKNLRDVKADSIPINFYLPLPGTRLPVPNHLTPEYCLRVLCLFRQVNPAADIRVAAGREYYLRRMEVMALFPATSLFLNGYLNVRGLSNIETLRMIHDAGFSIRSDRKLADLIKEEERKSARRGDGTNLELKTWDELHPLE